MSSQAQPKHPLTAATAYCKIIETGPTIFNDFLKVNWYQNPLKTVEPVSFILQLAVHSFPKQCLTQKNCFCCNYKIKPCTIVIDCLHVYVHTCVCMQAYLFGMEHTCMHTYFHLSMHVPGASDCKASNMHTTCTCCTWHVNTGTHYMYRCMCPQWRSAKLSTRTCLHDM